jgi:DNA-binding NtrC family response regulator
MTTTREEHDGALPSVLIVDDDSIVSRSIAELLRSHGYEAMTAPRGKAALKLMAQREDEHKPIGVVITDLQMPGMTGLELLERLSVAHRETVVIVITGFGSISSAVRAVKMGAVEYLTKPIVDDELKLAVEKAVARQMLLAENALLKKRLHEAQRNPGIVGQEHNIQRILEVVHAVAPTPTTVHMSGESGTGKSLIARTIHELSDRADGPFVELACGSIPETLLESELFGHTRGSFTGAHADKQGKFEAADGGTIFLDEINSASPALQLKLLRVLQERCFEAVGSTEKIEVDVRIVVATNEPLEALVAEGRFRQDLYYRICVVTLELPPLRERPSDIPLLVDYFLVHHTAALNKVITEITPEAMRALERYNYPGNIRELSNIIERAAVLSRQSTITIDDLPETVTRKSSSATALSLSDDDSPWVPMALTEALRSPERDILLKALRANAWNRQKTADDLEINRTTLYKKIKSYGLDRLAG